MRQMMVFGLVALLVVVAGLALLRGTAEETALGYDVAPDAVEQRDDSVCPQGEETYVDAAGVAWHVVTEGRTHMMVECDHTN